MALIQSRVLLGLLTVLLTAGPIVAQSSMGTVDGTVTDQSGSVIPGATVTLTNMATNVQAVRQTSDSGYFVFVNVRPGTYTLTIELAGLKTARVEPFAVGVNETVARKVALEVGSVSETVTVTATSPLLQTSSAELGHVIDQRVISELPMQGRNFTTLLLLSPGVNPVSTAQGA